MFTTEQHINPAITKRPKNGVFITGMPLAKGKHVNLRFTYKEVTLVLGIFVALVVAFTLWTGHKGISLYPESVRSTTSAAVTTIVHEIVKGSASSVEF